jgi:hypothetical protein
MRTKLFVGTEDLSYLFIGQLRIPVVLALSAAPTSRHIRGVIVSDAYIKMGRIDARRIIAVVEYELSFGYWPHKQLPCISVCEYAF